MSPGKAGAREQKAWLGVGEVASRNPDAKAKVGRETLSTEQVVVI